MSAKNRILLEKILYDMRYDMDCIGEEADLFAEIAAMTDEQIEAALDDLTTI